MIKLRCLVNTFGIRYQVYRHFQPASNIDPNGKYVLINDCNTVFGHTLAVELDKQGFNVFAGVYDSKNKSILKDQLSTRATVFSLDTTRSEDINNIYNLVTKETNTLHALIDTSTINYLECNTMESMNKKMNQAFFGHVSMTKKFLPLLTAKQDSRIINICSVDSVLDLPLESTYCSRKDALKSFSDSLRHEMASSNLNVSIIEPPMMHKTIIERIDGYIRKFWNKQITNVQKDWNKEFVKMQMKQMVTNQFHYNSEHSMKTIQAFEHAIMNIKPQIHYRFNWKPKFDFFSKIHKFCMVI